MRGGAKRTPVLNNDVARKLGVDDVFTDTSLESHARTC